MPGADRERRARQLRLVLQCAGPGSVTGSRSSQCQREGRPHGGYKGLSSKYPLSRPGFDKQEFMEEVKNSVNAQYQEEQKCRSNSPQWLPAANKEKNHTGEQPLILQSFLAPNKQEQIDGVLPAPKPVGKRQSKSAGMYRDDPDYYCRGNSTHQYLTATEMPGQSERLVDLTLGRPTRTSLLRVRQRTKSAPGVRAVVEIKTHLHKQQYLAAKTEERYKNVEVPQDLLPVTENHETVHQFLIGARYNRMYHHDAKCLHKLGLFVSRQDPLHCYKMNVPAKDNQVHGSMSSLSLTESCQSFVSDSNLNELMALSTDNQDPKSAWSTAEQEDHMRTSKGTVCITTSAPSPSPANRSHETVTSKRAAGWKNRPKLKVIDGKTLSHSKQDSGHECCIMCKGEEPAKHYQRFAPGSHFARVRDAGKEDQGHNEDHMLVQQHHLRIMGIKYGVKSGTQASPRSNLLYATKKSTHTTELPVIKQPKNLRSTNKYNSSDNGVSPPTESQAVRPVRPPSNSSKISVRISTHSEDGEDEILSPQDAPRNDTLPEGGESSKDANNNPSGMTANSLDKQLVESGEEGQDKIRNDESAAESGPKVSDKLLVGDSPEDTGISQDSPSGTAKASADKYMELGEETRAKARNYETVQDSDEPATTGDLPVLNTKGTDVSHDTTGEYRLKNTSCLGSDALEEVGDPQVGSTQHGEEPRDASAGDTQDIPECPEPLAVKQDPDVDQLETDLRGEQESGVEP